MKSEGATIKEREQYSEKRTIIERGIHVRAERFEESFDETPPPQNDIRSKEAICSTPFVETVYSKSISETIGG